jgi:hypothetical protein
MVTSYRHRLPRSTNISCVCVAADMDEEALLRDVDGKTDDGLLGHDDVILEVRPPNSKVYSLRFLFCISACFLSMFFFSVHLSRLASRLVVYLFIFFININRIFRKSAQPHWSRMTSSALRTTRMDQRPPTTPRRTPLKIWQKRNPGRGRRSLSKTRSRQRLSSSNRPTQCVRLTFSACGQVIQFF